MKLRLLELEKSNLETRELKKNLFNGIFNYQGLLYNPRIICFKII